MCHQMVCTVISYLLNYNAAAFITFEQAEGGGAYLRVAFIRGRRLLFQDLLRPAMVQVVGTVAGPGALDKESQQLPTTLSVKLWRGQEH